MEVTLIQEVGEKLGFIAVAGCVALVFYIKDLRRRVTALEQQVSTVQEMAKDIAYIKGRLEPKE